jgi:hypothetical protein
VGAGGSLRRKEKKNWVRRGKKIKFPKRKLRSGLRKGKGKKSPGIAQA